MGTYVYALSTKVHTISNVTVGVAEFRYKPSLSDDKLNERMHNQKCSRRIKFFENNKLPFFFVTGKLEDGTNVYSHLTKDNHLVGSCFDDGIKYNRVGTLTKVGRSWVINWI